LISTVFTLQTRDASETYWKTQGKVSMKQFYRLSILAALLLIVSLRAQELHWYKGNTHTHTINSDGDSTPDDVVRWYKEHGYNFLVLSDHNFLTEVEGLNSIFGAKDKFLLFRGEEVTDSFKDKPVHVNGLNINDLVLPQHGDSILETVQNNVNSIRKVGGVPHINHPNFHWTLTADDIRRVQNDRLFEIYNGHPAVHNFGGGGSSSLEQMWDDILISGKLLYGIAVDDAHHFKGEFGPERSNPGRGWVMVRAPELSARAILEAMENGNFYASTGVTLADYNVSPEGIKITIAEKPTFKYTTYFIGDGGKLLSTSHGPVAYYRFGEAKEYVRARVVDSMGSMAWTQPVVIKNP
jgi:hypothetical protein